MAAIALSRPAAVPVRDPQDKEASVMDLSPTPQEYARGPRPPTALLQPDPTPPMRTLRPLRRSSSRIQRWVQDQQKRLSGDSSLDGSSDSPDDPTPAASSGCHPWLAYPDVSRPAPSRKGGADPAADDAASIAESYVVIDEELSNVLRNASITQLGLQTTVALASTPSTPRKTRQTTVTFGAPASLRNFALHFATRKSSASSPPSVASQSPARSSIFQRVGQGKQSSHTRTPSASSSIFTPRPERDTLTDLTAPSASPSSWKFKRATGLHAHFASAPSTLQAGEPTPRLSTSTTRTVSSEATPQPRPSTSSSRTHSSDAFAPPTRPSMTSSRTRSSEPYFSRSSAEAALGPQKLSFARDRPPSPASFFSSAAPSMWSLPTDASHMCDPPGSVKTLAHDRAETASLLLPLALRTKPPSLMSNPRSKKRKLVISGIPAGDQRRYDQIRRWCESFGELSQITRIPNGDLHVDFRRAEVAETVCRLHARVHINGVGSVGLSWFTGKRP